MADLGGIGAAVGEVVGAVAEPVKDEVGAALEAGQQAIMGSTPTPQDATKKAEEEKQKAEFKWVIEKNKQLDDQLRAVRQQKAEEAQKIEQATQQQEKVQQFKVVQRDQRREAMKRQVQEAKTRSETRKGVGG